MKAIVFLLASFVYFNTHAQNLPSKLASAMTALEKDKQFEHSILAMYVVETNSGNVVFEHNAQTGLAPASCQKVITSASAFELLGKDYRYVTKIGYDKTVSPERLGNLFFIGSGDPTFGSWRWPQTKQENILQKLFTSLKREGIKNIDGGIYIDDLRFSYNAVPDGWIWQDIGNYYGAGAWSLNWHENQYDIDFSSTEKVGENTTIVGYSPIAPQEKIINQVKSAKKGSGDNVYLYATPYSSEILASGTIPAGEKKFTVSGSYPNPPMEFATSIGMALVDRGFGYNGVRMTYSNALKNNLSSFRATHILDSIVSPPLDSINYWFLKKSINLYGEAFVKTIASQQTRIGSTDSGIAVIRQFWKSKGIDPVSLKILDGSGLSPANRVTTNALVSVLQYAKKQPWFNSFYNALPEMNSIKMKDGYIGGVRSYTGYVKSKEGKEYTFSFIVNNFDGSPGSVREKMWKLLDLLK